MLPRARRAPRATRRRASLQGRPRRRLRLRRRANPVPQHGQGHPPGGAERGRAALSIQTSSKNPYDGTETDAGFEYAYRSGSVDQADNVALREAHLLRAPSVYFVGIRPGVYRPEYPGRGGGRPPLPAHPDRARDRCGAARPSRPRTTSNAATSPARRGCACTSAASSRGLVLTAYRDRCAVCRLHDEPRRAAARRLPHHRRPGPGGGGGGAKRARLVRRSLLLDPPPGVRPGSGRRLT